MSETCEWCGSPIPDNGDHDSYDCGCVLRQQRDEARKQIATLTAELSLARVSVKIEGDAVHKIRTSVPDMVHELLPDLLDDVLLRLATITAERDSAVVVLQKVEHRATVFSMKLKEYCPGCPCCGRPYNEPHWPACELKACLPKEET